MTDELKRLLEERFGTFYSYDAGSGNGMWHYSRLTHDWIVREYADGMWRLKGLQEEYTEQQLIKVLKLYAFT